MEKIPYGKKYKTLGRGYTTIERFKKMECAVSTGEKTT